MAKEWYLMDTHHDTVSGFETDDFENLAADAFNEALDSAVGCDVEICNYDLTERIKKRVIIEGNLQDTRLNAMQRKILAPVGTCVAGQYVYYKNRYWLIIGLVDDNGVYEKGVMMICNYYLTWKNDAGEIIQRWVNASSASQYNNGETSSDRYLTFRDDQIMVLTPNDDESVLIPHGKRFIIDNRCKIYERHFPADTTKSTDKPLITYNVTRLDNVLFTYQNSGHSEFMATQDEQHEQDGYYVIDGKGYWLCDEPDEVNETTVLSCYIECDEPVVYNAVEPTVFTARFTDAHGNAVDVEPHWEIDSTFTEKLYVESAEDAIMVSVTDKKLIGKTFTLLLSADGYETTSVTVMIDALI